MNIILKNFFILSYFSGFKIESPSEVFKDAFKFCCNANTDSAKEASLAVRIGKRSEVEGKTLEDGSDASVSPVVKFVRFALETEVSSDFNDESAAVRSNVSVDGAIVVANGVSVVNGAVEEVAVNNVLSVVGTVKGSVVEIKGLVVFKLGKLLTKREEASGVKEGRVVGNKFSNEFNLDDKRDSELTKEERWEFNKASEETFKDEGFALWIPLLIKRLAFKVSNSDLVLAKLAVEGKILGGVVLGAWVTFAAVEFVVLVVVNEVGVLEEELFVEEEVLGNVGVEDRFEANEEEEECVGVDGIDEAFDTVFTAG